MIWGCRMGVVALFLLCVSSGCSFSKGYYVGTIRNDREVNAADVRTPVEVDGAAWQSIGRVHVHYVVPNWLPWMTLSTDEMMDILKAEAATLNAEAIVDIKRYSRSQFEWEEEHLVGTAVVSKRLGEGK